MNYYLLVLRRFNKTAFFSPGSAVRSGHPPQLRGLPRRELPDRVAGRRALPLRGPRGRGGRPRGQVQEAHQGHGGGLRTEHRLLLWVKPRWWNRTFVLSIMKILEQVYRLDRVNCLLIWNTCNHNLMIASTEPLSRGSIRNFAASAAAFASSNHFTVS